MASAGPAVAAGPLLRLGRWLGASGPDERTGGLRTGFRVFRASILRSRRRRRSIPPNGRGRSQNAPSDLQRLVVIVVVHLGCIDATHLAWLLPQLTAFLVLVGVRSCGVLEPLPRIKRVGFSPVAAVGCVTVAAVPLPIPIVRFPTSATSHAQSHLL
jgi:hypothetical protein